MVKTNRIRKGFSLVELVVVILIMGVLAAVAAPKMFDTAETARTNGTKQSLAVIRDALELYKSQNDGYPLTAAALETGLSTYIKGSFPKNSHNDLNTIEEVTTTPTVATGSSGWFYNTTDGTIKANHSLVIEY